MQTLHARVRNVPEPERCRTTLNNPPDEKATAILGLVRSAARAAVLLALCDTPGRGVLTVCAVGLAQLREATRLGAPLGCMTLEFEVTPRALRRSIPRRPALHLAYGPIHGPTGEEAEARSGKP